MKALNYIALSLVIVGAVNWGLIGFLDFNLVDALFGTGSVLSRIIYAVVGVCGLYALSLHRIEIKEKRFSFFYAMYFFYMALDRFA